MLDELRIIEKPDSISWDTIHQILYQAHESNRQQGVFMRTAMLKIDAGADAVFGTHSHCISSFSQYKKKPIIYGMGNFLYPDNCLKPPRPFYYPRTTEELINMPKCINYPMSVANPVVCVWGKDSRIGMAVEALIDDPITARTRFVKMGYNNILCFYRSYSKVKDYLLSFLVSPILNTITRMPFYDIFYKLAFRVSRSITYRFSDFRKDV